jgi:hypothetical protein
MNPEQREALQERFNFRCGYCGVSETDAGAEMTADHFQPSSKGGADNSSNWIYCCHACNEFKSNYWNPDSVDRVLNPLVDDISEHLNEMDDGQLRGRTVTGNFFIQKLKLNRPTLVAHRLQRTRREHMTERYKQLEERIAVLEARLAEIEESTNENEQTE